MGIWTVGRKNTNDIVVDYPSVSRHHVKIIGDGPLFEIKDLGSTAGTFVRRDGLWARIQRAEVAADDPVRLGDHATSARALLGTTGETIDGLPPETSERETERPEPIER